MKVMISFPALPQSMKNEAIVTITIIKGNSEKNALKANAAAHFVPSIRQNFLTARQNIVQPLWKSGKVTYFSFPFAGNG
jgi:hypothetical protein